MANIKFGTDGWRAIVGKDFNDANVKLVIDAIAKYVFDKFFRSQSVIKRNIPGMGLGLAYVKLLVHAHKGIIEVKSEEGSGTVFIINLPQ